MADELQSLRKQVEELTELVHLQSQRAADYAGAFMRSKREWAGLTKEEVKHIVQGNTDPWCDTPETDGYGVAEMVEAKLRERNT